MASAGRRSRSIGFTTKKYIAAVTRTNAIRAFRNTPYRRSAPAGVVQTSVEKIRYPDQAEQGCEDVADERGHDGRERAAQHEREGQVDTLRRMNKVTEPLGHHLSSLAVGSLAQALSIRTDWARNRGRPVRLAHADGAPR